VTTIDIDAEISKDDVTIENAEELFLLEPFGVSNPTPVFAMRDCTVADAIPIGSNRHTKYILKKDGKSITALCFGKNPTELDLYSGDSVDVVFNLDVNEYMNNKSVQFTLRDVRAGSRTMAERDAKRAAYWEIKNGRRFSRDEQIVPSREDFISVYYAIQREIRQGNETISVVLLERTLKDMGYVKIRFIVDILKETNVFKIETKDGEEDVYLFKMNSFKSKINLEKSSILGWLKSRQEK